ncbi:MAG: tRNA uridine-5-carboxymethylaminomethyl(34) synthesis enzyme MnmG [Candidatus Krumholzibacteriota bacterium]|nr:tRNA uridine-5-carboxymethylaminomethyl(34) synthesis enzyme MnmG [Candidatus Krumholzibacteriota bacterium]
MTRRCDVLVVGGGHAGCEAALAAARMGHGTVLATLRIGDIARMPCNPAIGGLAKGQIVREIDALGGEMARCIDLTGIQFRMLNRGKGPAVWSPRAQADKAAYHERMLAVLQAQAGLDIVEGEVVGLEIGADGVEGVVMEGGGRIAARRVVLALGTFPNGVMHIGERRIPGGREGERPSIGLTDQLAGLGLERRRLKTGTPPRIARDTVDYGRCREQPGDEPPSPFSFETGRLDVDQVSCWITWTNERTHRLIRENLDRAPLFSGQITGVGPRYCPSIEDKVVRFGDRDRHLLFLEPEGRDVDEIYVNGLATSLPVDVQEGMIQTIPGLEQARIVRYGYAIEYDVLSSRQLRPTLESRLIPGLFLAGQINGTSGYEEAAAQGIVAGINACLGLRNERPFVPGRHEAYIGVLIDDLVTKEIVEPYRMFTSRAEYRLLLRQDNADERLYRYGVRFGLVDAERWRDAARRRRRVLCALRRIAAETVPAAVANALGGNETGRVSALQLLQRPGVGLEAIEGQLPGGTLGLDDRGRFALGVRVAYDGYIRRQRRTAEKMLSMETTRIPDDFSYDIDALSREGREKLDRFRPATLGAASRIDGVRSADLSILMVFLDRRRRGKGTP